MKQPLRNNHLVADIGGTHTRIALDIPDTGLDHIGIFANRDYPDLASLVDNYLDGLEGIERPVIAAFAVACPVAGDQITLTNLDWTFSITEYRSRFRLEQLHVINDFFAIALAIPGLLESDLIQIGKGTALTSSPIGILGPGTGLGVAGLIPSGEDWVPVATEGGHVTLPAVTDREAVLIRQLRAQFGHVSAERILSGPGLSVLYQALASLEGNTVQSLDAAGIINLARTGEDPLALETTDVFFALLGTVAGNLALTLGARGGIYLAGGILPRIPEMLQASSFRERFMDKGRYRAYLETIPVFLITNETPALIGLQTCMGKNYSLE